MQKEKDKDEKPKEERMKEGRKGQNKDRDDSFLLPYEGEPDREP